MQSKASYKLTGGGLTKYRMRIGEAALAKDHIGILGSHILLQPAGLAAASHHHARRRRQLVPEHWVLLQGRAASKCERTGERHGDRCSASQAALGMPSYKNLPLPSKRQPSAQKPPGSVPRPSGIPLFVTSHLWRDQPPLSTLLAYRYKPAGQGPRAGVSRQGEHGKKQRYAGRGPVAAQAWLVHPMRADASASMAWLSSAGMRVKRRRAPPQAAVCWPDTALTVSNRKHHGV